MASQHDVKKYLAYWLQLGRGVQMPGQPSPTKPATMLGDDAYSDEFETLWVTLQTPSIADQSYLEGTDQTITQLLSTSWIIEPCARCALPVPLKEQGILMVPSCPCADMGDAPNLDDFPPREPVSSQGFLRNLTDRLQSKN
jgi:hypothetical protein